MNLKSAVMLLLTQRNARVFFFELMIQVEVLQLLSIVSLNSSFLYYPFFENSRGPVIQNRYMDKERDILLTGTQKA